MKKGILSLSIIAFIIAGCNEKPDFEPYRDVDICFTVDSVPNSLLKLAASSTEKAITKIILLGVEGQNVRKLHETTGNPGSIKLTISKTITALYAIANPSPTLETAIPSTLTNLNNLTNTFGNSMPQPNFLMSGSVTLSSGVTSISINLVRVVARVDIRGANGFVISSVTVQNTPSQGYVFSKTPFVVPSGVANYNAVSTSATPTLYVTENTNTNATNSTKFLVSGRLNSGSTTQYTVELKSNGQYINIVRNSYYLVTITPKTEIEYTIQVTIPEWSDVITDPYEF